LQQVGAKGFANAQPVDPRQFPMPLPKPAHRRMLVSAGHMWVLHRKQIVRAWGVLLVLVVLAGLFQARDMLATGAGLAFRFVQGEFAEAGFGLDSIEITGQTLTSDAEIATLLTAGMGNSTLTFDVQKAQARLSWLAAVESAKVRKVYPDRVIVELVERQPAVRWRVGETTWLLDERGRRIGTDVASYTDLPLVIGQGAADDAVPMVRIMDRHPKLMESLAALSRIGDRRWDLIYRSGLRVQLPEQGVAQALNRLEDYQRDYQLLERDVTQIDLRVPGFVALKPGELAAEQIAAANKERGKPMPSPATPAAVPATTGSIGGAGAPSGGVQPVVPLTRPAFARSEAPAQ
jgi:cell division protein FtsQ